MTAPESNSADGKPSYKILLAEDNDMNRELATRLLQRRGHTVVSAVNGQEAVDRYREGPFDVILMDMEMPVMDGLEATRQIRALEQQAPVPGAPAHMPVIAMTAYDQQEIARKIQEAGLDGLITKPIDTKELDANLRRIVEKVRTEFSG